MKCVNCGTELKTGCLYCPGCGKEVQIVPDYNEYDDDYLKQVLTENNQPQVKPVVQNPSNNKKKTKTYVIIGCTITVVFLLIIGIVIAFGVRNQRANSFSYQVQKAEEAYRKGDVENAIAYYENALALDHTDTEVRLVLAQIYMERRDFDSALILCQEVIQMDDANAEACGILISIYESEKNYDAVLALYESTDESLQDMFSAYVVTAPVFSVEAGEKDEFISLELSTSGDFTIYYSLDGSDPTLRGERYTEPIVLDENLKTYRVAAVCMNEKGIYSEIVSQEYLINIPAPQMPIVTPDGGNIGVETTVTVTIPDNCSAYYTWDGTDPTIYSTQYTKPITIPEGNNVLAVILIDNTTNLTSDIYRGNFVYYVEDSEGESISGPDREEAEE